MKAQRMRWRDGVARLHWTARVVWARWAWPEFIAIAAIGFALGLLLWVNSPLQLEVRRLQTRATNEALRAPVAESAPQAHQPAGDSPDFVAAFMAFLPMVDMREQQLQTLHALAGQSGVALSRVAYSHADLAHLSGRRTAMQLTIRADYAAHRRFLHDLLVAMPNLAIDRVTTERVPGQAVEMTGALDVRIDASLYYRSVAVGGMP